MTTLWREVARGAADRARSGVTGGVWRRYDRSVPGSASATSPAG